MGEKIGISDTRSHVPEEPALSEAERDYLPTLTPYFSAGCSWGGFVHRLRHKNGLLAVPHIDMLNVAKLGEDAFSCSAAPKPRR